MITEGSDKRTINNKNLLRNIKLISVINLTRVIKNY